MKKTVRLLFSIVSLLFFISCGDSESEKPDNSYLRISTQERMVTNPAGYFGVTVSSNTSWKVEALNVWLKPEKVSGSGEAYIRIDFDENSTTKRSGIVRFSAPGIPPIDLIVTQTELTFSNPIAGIPDPWIIKHNNYYYVCKADGGGINISKSDRLSQLNPTKRVWNAPKDGAGRKPWNVTNIWAPELHLVDGTWYIYYAAGRPHAETNSYQYQRTGVLRAKTDDPTGEWEDMGMIYTGDNYKPGIEANADNTSYAIDMGVFELKGKLYAVWSGNPVGNGDQHLYIATMENPYTISSSRVQISKPDKPWELYSGKVNEGPSFLKNEKAGKFFVVYSCNGSWTKDYRLGYLELDDTLDPLVSSNWKKSSNHIFYRNDNTTSKGVNGVGHCSFTKSPDETEDWIVYHTKNSREGGWESGRSTFIQKITWNDNGTPNLGTPVGWGEVLALPSGEIR